jgi:hypothetical protein
MTDLTNTQSPATKTLCIVEEGNRSAAMLAVHRLGCRHIAGRTQDWIVEVPHGHPVAPPVEAVINADGLGLTVKSGWIKIHSCCKRRPARA